MIEKTERITVRFTPEAEQWVIKQAEKAGVSKGRYLRQVALCEIPQAEIPYHKKNRKLQVNKSMTIGELKQVINHDLPKVGNNLNQVTKYINEQQNIGPKQTEEIQMIRKNMNKITRTILRALQ